MESEGDLPPRVGGTNRCRGRDLFARGGDRPAAGGADAGVTDDLENTVAGDAGGGAIDLFDLFNGLCSVAGVKVGVKVRDSFASETSSSKAARFRLILALKKVGSMFSESERPGDGARRLSGAELGVRAIIQ